MGMLRTEARLLDDLHFCRYDAAEENEISFAEGDRITNISAPSDDWWEGTAPNGQVGLFPANYVELQ